MYMVYYSESQKISAKMLQLPWKWMHWTCDQWLIHADRGIWKFLCLQPNYLQYPSLFEL